MVVYQSIQWSWAPKAAKASESASCSTAVKELGNGMSYPVHCLPSVSAWCLKGVALTTKQEMEGEHWEYGKFKKKKMKDASQSKSESYGRVQGEVLVTVTGIGVRQLQTSYGQGLLCVL